MTSKELNYGKLHQDAPTFARIVDFPWTQSNSHVALLSDVKSKLELDIDDQDKDDDELDILSWMQVKRNLWTRPNHQRPTSRRQLPMKKKKKKSPTWMMECDGLWTTANQSSPRM
jgi:hypothetical protein